MIKKGRYKKSDKEARPESCRILSALVIMSLVLVLSGMRSYLKFLSGEDT